MKKLLAVLLIALPITTFGSISGDITAPESTDISVDLVEISKTKKKIDVNCEYAKSFVLTTIDKEAVTLLAIKFNLENTSTSAIIPYFHDFGITVGDNLTRYLSSNLFKTINPGETGTFTFYFKMDKIPDKIDVKTGTSTTHLDVIK